MTIGPESGNKEKAAVIGHRIVSQTDLAAFDMGTSACAFIGDELGSENVRISNATTVFVSSAEVVEFWSEC